MKPKNNLLTELEKILKESGDVNLKMFGMTKKVSIWIELLREYGTKFKEVPDETKSSTKRKVGKKRVQTVTRSKRRIACR